MARIGIRWPLYRRSAPFTPTDAERHMLSEPLQYDIQMTFDLAHVLNVRFQTPPATALDQLVNNALVESFLARARSLVEFFWHDRRKQEDALAADYFPPGEWKRMRPARPPRLDRLVTAKVGWGAMHLTYRRARSTPADKQWVGLEMCAALEPTVRLFIDNVDASQFDPQTFVAIQPFVDRFKALYPHVQP